LSSQQLLILQLNHYAHVAHNHNDYANALLGG